MAVGVDPIGRVIQNLITVRRIGNSVAAEARVYLDALFEQIAADLERIDPTAPRLAKWRRYRMEQFLAAVGERLSAAVPAWESRVRAGLAAAGRMQGEWAAGTIAASLGAPVGAGVVRATPITQNLIRTILTTDPFGGAEGQYTLSEWAGSLEEGTRRRIVKQVRVAMTLEESIPDMVRRIRGTQKGWRTAVDGTKVRNFIGGVYQASTRDAEAIVRTAVTYVSSEAHLATFRENAHALAGVQYSATLDSSTTEICLFLDGTVWPVDSDKIIVPGLHTHVGCRSTLVPVPDYAKFGLEPPPETFRKARDLSDLSAEELNKRMSVRRRQGLLGKNIDVSSRVTAERWLKGQPMRVQVKMLGKGKAVLFREGKITLRDIVSDDLTIVPLSELL